MDLKIFKDKNDYAKGKGSGIFEYENLREFEKILFLEHNVTELIKLLKRKNAHIKDITEQMDRVIDTHQDSKQVKALKAEITNNQRIIKKQKELIKQLTS